MTVLRAAPTLREASQAIADFAWSAIRLIDTPEAAQHLQTLLNDLRAALAHPPEGAQPEPVAIQSDVLADASQRLLGIVAYLTDNKTPNRDMPVSAELRYIAKRILAAHPVPAAPDAALIQRARHALVKSDDGDNLPYWGRRLVRDLLDALEAAALPAPSVPATDQDALRYRFLRNEKDWGGWYWDGSNNMFHGEDLDTAIDDAMAAPSSLGSASGDEK